MTRKTIYDAERDYQRYRRVIDDDGNLLADAPADVVDDLDYMFAQKALWKTGGGYSFTVGVSSVIITSLQKLVL